MQLVNTNYPAKQTNWQFVPVSQRRHARYEMFNPGTHTAKTIKVSCQPAWLIQRFSWARGGNNHPVMGVFHSIAKMQAASR